MGQPEKGRPWKRSLFIAVHMLKLVGTILCKLTGDRTFFPAPGDPLNFVRSRKRPVRNSDIVKQSFAERNSVKGFMSLMRWH